MKKTARFEIQGINISDVTTGKFGNRPPTHIFLLLHGFNENGELIFKRLEHIFKNQNALVIAPNGPFPLPLKKENHYAINFAWYFYDNFKEEYFIDFNLPSLMLKNLLHQLNPHKLPVTIIGYSQGGYLAPFAGDKIEETVHVIGINCVFREDMLPMQHLNFHLDAIHGADDLLVSPKRSHELFQKIRPRTLGGIYQGIKGADHRLEGSIIDAIVPLLIKGAITTK